MIGSWTIWRSFAEGIVADSIVTQEEAERLRGWLRRNHGDEHPFSAKLMEQVEAALADGMLDNEEERALHDALMAWVGGGVEEGEVAKTATLPLDPEPRAVVIPGKTFVFTGTGVFGTRAAMHEATEQAGGIVVKNVTKKTDYVVLGTYMTPAWMHECQAIPGSVRLGVPGGGVGRAAGYDPAGDALLGGDGVRHRQAQRDGVEQARDRPSPPVKPPETPAFRSHS